MRPAEAEESACAKVLKQVENLVGIKMWKKGNKVQKPRRKLECDQVRAITQGLEGQGVLLIFHPRYQGAIRWFVNRAVDRGEIHVAVYEAYSD